MGIANQSNTAVTARRLSIAAGSVFNPNDQIAKENPSSSAALLQKVGAKVSLRLVKVIIADTCEDLPLSQRILFSGPEQATDLTDQELFFELDIKELLANQNAVRAKTLNKKASEKAGKDIFLDPVRVRDLKMVVVNVAVF